MPRSCTLFLLFLAVSSLFTFAVSSRLLLDEVENQPAATATTLPSGQIPAGIPAGNNDDDDDHNDNVPAVGPTSTNTVSGGPGPITTAAANPSGGTGPGSSVGPSATTAASNPATVGPSDDQHEPTLSFFMHDIIGGSHPSARVVTGIIAQTEVNGIPFSKANNNIFPVSGGTPLLNSNNINKIINPNTAPLLTGFNGAQTNTIIQNTNGGNGGNALSGNLPFVTAGQLPPGSALQQLMFGTITVIDDQLTEGHELGSAVIGRAQGFYLASSLDGTSQTMALTVLLHGGGGKDAGVEDAVSLFGVHRTASHVSQIAVVGGTGKYENAKGYATVETLHNQGDQHITDGVDTIVSFNIYLTY